MISGIASSHIIAQISPGKLSFAHEEFEGVSNCTQCHDLGNKVPDNKCLSCHKEITSLLDSGRGYHSSTEVKSKTCVDCHSEHHGRKFEMMRFDQENFDHSLTTYKLEGAHSRTECKTCHQANNIIDPEIRKRENTFLGLETSCIICHDDFHQSTLDSDCASCHTMESFEGAELFDHNSADFKLIGAHKEVTCLDCHPNSLINNVESQKFTNIPFANCTDCHQSPHGKMIGNCTDCHTQESFQEFGANNRFNHNLTDFALQGKHKVVSCFECHVPDLEPQKIFRDHKSVKSDDCRLCHDDQHEGKFGENCASCHNVESWKSLSAISDFDHDLTDFPLEGLHISVECKKCHVSGNYTDPLAFAQCIDCHTDYHEGEFQALNKVRDCKECHNVAYEFSVSTFGLEEHEATKFELEGSHIATACFSCHYINDRWTFRNLGTNCLDCHDNIHGTEITQEFLPNNDCRACHTTDLWSTIDFDHNRTEWDLTGKHKKVSCRACHFDENPANLIEQHFLSLDANCVTCHTNIHGSQFEEKGVTDCKRCHNTTSWDNNGFDHSQTRFPLEGKHKEIDCKACHNETFIENGNVKINFKIDRFECINCHS